MTRTLAEDLGRNAAIAVVYFLLAWLGMQMAIPPGYASAVWPAAGVAAWGALRCGPAILPGIFLGSVAANGLRGDLPLGMAIALGATTQAWLAQHLVRSLPDHIPPGQRSARTLRVLWLAGPLACVFGASWGVVSLYGFGRASGGYALANWWTWYVGDVLGVLTILPLATLFERGPERRQVRWENVVPIAAILVFSTLLQVAATRSEGRRLEREFSEDAALLSDTLTRRLSEQERQIAAIAALLSDLPGDEAALIDHVARAVIPRVPGVTALSWADAVPHDALAAYEARTGLTAFAVDADGTRRPPEVLPEHAIVRTIAPFGPNRRALGLDLASEERRREAIESARARGAMATSGPIRLVQDPQEGIGKLAATHVENPARRGWLVAVVRYDALTAPLLPWADQAGIQFALRDVATQQAVVRHGDCQLSRSAADALTTAQRLPFAGRTFELEVCRTQASLIRSWSWSVWGALTGQILVAILLSAFFVLLADRQDELEAIVRERTLELAAERARAIEAARLRSLGEMAGGIAHEINNPLAVIEGSAELLRESYLNDDALSREESAEILGLVADTVQRIARIVRAMRSLARDGSAEEPLHVPVRAMVDDALAVCASRLRADGITLTVEVPEALEAHCRPTPVAQILLNLLGNAADAVRGQPTRTITLRAEPAGRMVRVTVRDSGPTLPPEVVARLGEPFFTTKPVGVGTGLGLSISMGLALREGGALRYAPEGGETVFELLIQGA